MDTITKKYLGYFSGTLALSLLLTQPKAADDWVKYSASPVGSVVNVEGTSTFHDWAMESKIVGGTLEMDPKVQFDPVHKTVSGLDGQRVPVRAKIAIPVRSLKSDTQAMDNVCQDAMDAKKFPRIDYQLLELTAKDGARKPGAPLEFDSAGEITIHGVAKKITMPITIEAVDQNKLKIKGATSLKMTSFGVKPPSPSLSLGLLKTGDDVKISFDWLVVKKSNPTATAAK